MPGFNFKLQRVLQVKKYKEDQLKTELANLKREYLKQESILFTLEESVREQVIILVEKQRNLTNTINEILWRYNYISRLQEDIENQRKRLTELNEKIKEVTIKLIGASQEKQIIENLKERKVKQFKLEMEKQEQEFMDEVGITRFSRRDNKC